MSSADVNRLGSPLERRWRGPIFGAVVCCVIALIVAGCGGSSSASTSSASSSKSASSSSTSGTSNSQLVIDTQFDTPAGDIEDNNAIVNYYMLGLVYDTLLTYKPDASGNYDLSQPQPWLAQSWSANRTDTVFTFHLRPNVKFSDGTPLTSKDVVFSLLRATNLKAAPSFIGACFKSVTAPDPLTVVITTTGPCPQLPADLTTKSAGIVNSAVVQAHGGTDAADAATADKATNYFNSHSLGSGPYVLQSFNPNGPVTLVRNPLFWGPKPYFAKIVYENVTPSIARLNVLSGQAQIAMGLSANQTASLQGNPQVQVVTKPSSTVFYLQANANPSVSAVAANPTFWHALRYAIDYHDLLTLMGSGTVQSCGVIPVVAVGALPQADCVQQDLAKAKQLATQSGATATTLKLEFPTEFTLNGVSFQTVAEALQGYLQQAGIKTTLEGLPLATWLPRWMKGIQELNVGALAPAYVDPAQMLVYDPEGYRGQYAGWKPGDAPAVTKSANTASTAIGTSAREAAFDAYQQVLNQQSPIIPLFDPPMTIVAAKSITGLNSAVNPQYVLDPTLLGEG
jgi:peptide/nickel transport system substrate-binding protein